MRGIAVLVLANLCLGTPATALDESGLLREYRLTTWRDSDGVPLGSVNALAQDLDGYLWIGADTGLIRFDGSRFVRWRESNAARLSTSVLALCVSKDGTLWVGFANDGGVLRVRNGIVDAPGAKEQALRSVGAIAEDGAGRIWAISGGRLFLFSESQWTAVALDGNPMVLSLYTGTQGRLLVGTNLGLWQETSAQAQFRKFTNDLTWSASEDSFGTIWVTDPAVAFRNLGGISPRFGSSQGNGYRLLHDTQGSLWIGTINEGLWRVPAARGRNIPQIQALSIENGLLSSSVSSLLADRESNIWIGTTGGLHRLTPRLLSPVTNGVVVTALEPTGNGSMWVGATTNLRQYTLHKYTPGDSRPIGRALELPFGGWIQTLHQDASGALWISAGGVRRLEGSQLSEPIAASGQLLTRVGSITSDSSGSVWLSDRDRGVFRWSAGRLAQITMPVDASPQLVFADSRGNVWVALRDGQIGLIDSEANVRLMDETVGLPAATHSAVHAVFEDRHHVMWVAGTGGLSRYANGRFKTISQEEGLPGNDIWTISESESGDMWFSMDVGIVRVRADALTKVFDSSGEPLRYTLFDAADGLTGSPVFDMRSARSGDDRLWFVRGGSLTIVTPSILRSRETAGVDTLRIDAAKADHVLLGPKQDVYVPAGTKTLEISYTVLSLTLAEKTRFRYRLDGFDTDWVEAGGRRVAYYTNLPPGSYSFNVEADVNGDSLRRVAWAFIVEPRFYQTATFAVICGFAVLGLVGAAWTVRLRLLRREFAVLLAERLRLSREMHDTLLQSMVGFYLQLEVAQGLAGVPRAVSDLLVRLRRQVEIQIEDARQTIWDLRSAVSSLGDVTEAIREFGNRTAATANMTFALSVTGSVRRCSTRLEHHLLRIAQEAIVNATRHSSARSVSVNINYTDSSVVLTVTDDGNGFDVHSAFDSDDHLGLIAMRERAEEMRGRFHIDASPGRGTIVTTALPFRATTA
jgi:signal transduction histidine kinase/ligand-binding sensor domain-containing protein